MGEPAGGGLILLPCQRTTTLSDTGEESPNGAPRKMHAFCGVPGLEGGNQDNLETKSSFGAHLNTTLTPSEYYLVPRREFGGENSPPNGVQRVMKQLRRGAGGPLRACVYFNFSSLSRARKIFACVASKNFSAQFLDKTYVRTSYKQISVGARGCNALAKGVWGYNTPASKNFRRNSLTKHMFE